MIDREALAAALEHSERLGESGLDAPFKMILAAARELLAGQKVWWCLEHNTELRYLQSMQCWAMSVQVQDNDCRMVEAVLVIPDEKEMTALKAPCQHGRYEAHTTKDGEYVVLTPDKWGQLLQGPGLYEFCPGGALASSHCDHGESGPHGPFMFRNPDGTIRRMCPGPLDALAAASKEQP